MTTGFASDIALPQIGKAFVSRQRDGSAFEIVSEIWERVLQQSPIEADANFFDLGGDSLLAIALFDQILKETGRELPITTIYDAPTIETLTALLNEETEARAEPLVLLKAGQEAPPLFIIHGIGGTVIELFALGRKLDYAGAVYAIQARGLDGHEPPAENMDDMADAYLLEIGKVQKEGPYLLSGYSFGGLVALEVARRMVARGDEVAFLGFFDSFAHPKSWPVLSRLQVRISRAIHRFQSLKRMSFGEVRRYATNRLKGTHNQRSEHGVGALQRRLFPIDMALPLPLIKTHDGAEAALRSYHPRPYPGKITFFQPQNVEIFFPTNPGRVWRRLSQGFELFRVPGNHEGIIEGNVDTLAACLSACLKKVTPQGGPLAYRD